MNRFSVVFSVVLALVSGYANAGKILVPAYFYPSANPSQSHWDELIAAASKVDITAIINPDNGSGATANNDYTSAINALRGAGGKVIGYINSSNGGRDINLVKAEIIHYTNFYSMDGFFIDSMSNKSGQLPYYQDLYTYIKGLSPNYLVFGNPGTDTLESYLSVADTLMTFEGPPSSTAINTHGYDNYGVPTWMENYNSNRFGHLVYGVSDESTMQSLIDLAASRNAGYIYITDDILPNPWDTLPVYWNAEIAAVSILEPSSYYLFGAGLVLVTLMRPLRGSCRQISVSC